MRVLGVDPGLTRCGIGVVDGAPGPPARLVHVEVVRTPADAAGRRPAGRASPTRSPPRIARFGPDVVAVERVFSQHNVRTVMGTAQVAGLAIVAATRAGVPVALHTPSEVKAAVTGSGRRGQGAGGDDGHPAAAAGRDAAPGRRRRRAGAGDLPACGAAAPSSGCGAAARRRQDRMIASVRGTVAALGPDGAVVEVGGVGLAVSCSPGTLARLRVGRAGPAGDQPGRARGLADPVRLRRRRRAGAVRAAADRQRRRPEAGADDARRAPAARAAPRDRHQRPRRADAGARHRPQGRRADRRRAARPDRRDRRRRRRSTGGRSPLSRRGATSSRTRWPGSASPARRPARRSTSSPPTCDADGRRASIDAPDVPTRCCRRIASSCSGRDAERASADRGRRAEDVVDPLAGAGRARRRGEPAAEAARPSSSASRRCASSCSWCWRERAAPRPAAGPRPALRAARARQDQPRDDHRRRAGRADPGHQRPGDRAGRRPRGAAHQPHRGRGAVHRRDPPHRPARRGTAVHGDGGLPGRRRRRQGPGRHRDPARPRRRSRSSAPPPAPGC